MFQSGEFNNEVIKKIEKYWQRKVTAHDTGLDYISKEDATSGGFFSRLLKSVDDSQPDPDVSYSSSPHGNKKVTNSGTLL